MEAEITIECPGYKRKFRQKSLGMRPGMSRRCPHCKRTIKFTGDDLQKEVNEIEGGFYNLFKSLKVGRR